jgi:hypothetical protein
MKRVVWALFASIILSTGCMLAGSLINNGLIEAILAGITGVGWIVAAWRGWNRFGSLTLLIYVVIAGFSIIKGYAPLFLLVGVVIALVGWDLQDFYWRVRRSNLVKNVEDIVPIHLQRLAVIAGIGIAVSCSAALIHTRFSFGVVFVIGFLAIVMTGWVVSMLRNP